MANRPLQSRSWLILGSMRPAQAQPPTPPPIFRPRFGQTFRPTTPPQQPLPQPPTASTAAPPFQVGNVSSVPSNPSQNTTPPSEKIKPPSPSPSSLTLPPAHVKSTPDPIEQNIMLVRTPPPDDTWHGFSSGLPPSGFPQEYMWRVSPIRTPSRRGT
ncbi:hypothetical protein CK203_028721 [Vitis vinifera]|uniref:Uncharacterized protein n=1 Tax=Vitis vinifera TaxID=29760 RepID=A0A438DQF9_VITVI|nr:hypothetical protein CK203_109483 [Vitis vinifera]RVW95511.1 hypothetical protein CK203_028721 [Vitis vinifera]